MNDRVQINSQVKQYTPNGLPQIKSDWKKKITLLARYRGDDLASPMSLWLIAQKNLYILITFFFDPLEMCLAIETRDVFNAVIIIIIIKSGHHQGKYIS